MRRDNAASDEPGRSVFGDSRSGWLLVASRAAVPIIVPRRVARRQRRATGFDSFDSSDPCPNCSNSTWRVESSAPLNRVTRSLTRDAATRADSISHSSRRRSRVAGFHRDAHVA